MMTFRFIELLTDPFHSGVADVVSFLFQIAMDICFTHHLFTASGLSFLLIFLQALADFLHHLLCRDRRASVLTVVRGLFHD